MAATSQTPPVNGPEARRAARLFWITAAIAAIFCIGVIIALVIRHVQSKVDDPLQSRELIALKARLLETPQNEQLKDRIRALDLRLRQVYFRQIAFQAVGAWLLVAGGALLVWSVRQAARLQAKVYCPRLVTDAAERQDRLAGRARRAVIGMGALAGLGLVALALSSGTDLPERPDQIGKFLARLAGEEDEEASGPMPAALFAANWPRFLGPTGNAYASNGVPFEPWDVATGAGILWRASATNLGFNSPIVWSNRVFLSGAEQQQREVFCYDADSGALVWRRPVANIPGSPAQLPEVAEGTGLAAPSMATDGRRAFVIFGNGDLAAFRFDGTLAWAKHLGVPKNAYGHATSLVPWQDRLLVQLDQGQAEQNRSRLYAFDGATGRIVWERTRAVPESWATPCVADTPAGPQIITLGGPWVIAYAATDGAELWRGEILMGEIAPSPIYVGGLVLAVSPMDRLVALRPDGQGDVTQSHVAWTAEDNIPDITSPAGNGELVFLASTYGTLTCYDARSGEKQWEHELEIEINATPAIARDRLLILGKKGEVLIAEAGREFKEVARFDMGEPVLASPALLSDRLLIRTTKTLFCIGAKAAESKAPENQP